MEKGRRDFLRKIGLFGAGICLPSFLGCEKKETAEPNGGGGSGDGNNPPPTPLTPFQKYTFNVDSPPNKNSLFEVVRGTSNSQGIINFGGNIGSDSFVISNKSGTERLEGIKGNCFFDSVAMSKRMVYVEDENKKYFPNIILPYGGGTKSGSIITMDKILSGLGFNGVWAKKLDEALPSWDWEKVNDKPGSIYLGDWTFDEIKNWTAMLEKGSLVITKNYPNAISASAYTVFSTAGAVLEGMDKAINIINYISPGTIDREKTYAWYQPILGVPFVSIFEPAAEALEYREEDIKEFFPSEVGNSWRYKLGSSLYEFKIKGLKTIKGKDLFVTQGVDGMEEYYGFYGGKLNHYGFNLSELGNVFFDPPITIGDSKIRKGKNFNTNSKVICENYKDITGTVQEIISYEGREVVAPLNNPYGGCFKVKEDTSFQLVNGSNVVNDSATTYHWFAKNVGKVKSNIDGAILSLYDYDLQNLKCSGKVNELEKKVSVSGRIGEAIKKLI